MLAETKTELRQLMVCWMSRSIGKTGRKNRTKDRGRGRDEGRVRVYVRRKVERVQDMRGVILYLLTLLAGHEGNFANLH